MRDRANDHHDQPPGLTIVLGMARSGTTWLGKILDSHPGTLYRHEPEKAIALEDIPVIVLPEDVVRYQETIRLLAERVPREARTDVAGILPVMKKRGESRIGFQLRRTGVMVFRVLAKVSGEKNLPSMLLEPRRTALSVVWK